jgi:hypothetical protein
MERVAVDQESSSVWRTPVPIRELTIVVGEAPVGLFRKKTVEETAKSTDMVIDSSTILKTVVIRSEVVADEIRSFSAAELQPFVTKAALSFGADARQYLIVGENVGRDGGSADWEFHVLFPALRAEGVWRLERSEDGVSSVLTGRVSPVPAPGTTEFLMAQISPQLDGERQKSWALRLDLIVPLPLEFADSPDVVAAIEALQPNVFVSGPIRLKARTPPTGGPVWEWKGSDLVHVPFVFPSIDAALVGSGAESD